MLLGFVSSLSGASDVAQSVALDFVWEFSSAWTSAEQVDTHSAWAEPAKRARARTRLRSMFVDLFSVNARKKLMALSPFFFFHVWDLLMNVLFVFYALMNVLFVFNTPMS